MRLLSGVSLVGISSLVLNAAHAQQAPEAGASDGGEIVVTAQRRSESLKNVPMSVNVATGAQLQKLNIFDVKDVAQLAPGLELTNNNGASNAATLRGVTYEPDSGTLPAVDTYINDIPVDAQTAFTAIYDIEQIEVLRGPQGALRGRTAPSGAITIRTRRADLDDITGNMQATATDRGGYNVQAGVSLPIVPGKLAVRVAALVDGNRVNHVYNVNRGDRSYGTTESARISLAWEPVNDFRADLTYQYLTSDSRQYQQVFGPGNTPTIDFGNADRSGPAAQPGDYIAVSDGNARFQNRMHLINLNMKWDLGKVAMEFNGAHQYSVLSQFLDADRANAVPQLALPERNRIPYDQNTAELRILSQNDGFWNWSVSGYYSKLRGDIYSQQYLPTFFTNAPASEGLYQPVSILSLLPTQPGRTLAIAASSRFDITDRLTFEAAARYTDTKYGQFIAVNIASAETSSINPADYPDGTFILADRRGHVKPLTGGATLRYKINSDLTTYLAYGRSYRQPTAAVGAPQGLPTDLLITKDERSDSFEAGLKGSLFNRRLNFEVAAFYQKFDGYIARLNNIAYDNGITVDGVSDGIPDGIVDGIAAFNYNGKAVIKGIEGTISGRPTENWDFSVSAAYAHARFDNARLPCNDFDGDGRSDSTALPDRAITGPGNVSYCTASGRLGDTPDFSLSARTELRFEAGNLEPFIRGLFTYRPSLASTLSAYNFQSRETLNLYVGVRGRDAQWELNAFAKNVLNQRRITAISPGVAQVSTITTDVYDSGYRTISTQAPREFGVTASYNF